MKTIHKVKIDVLTPGLHPRVYAVQDDICTREVQISLYSGSVSWTPTSGASVAVGYRKSDGTVGIYDTLPDGSSAVSISGNVVTVILAAQMLTCAGTVEAAVTLADANGNQISTFAFDVIVSANPGSGAIKSEDYFNYVNPKIQAVIEQAAAATTAANTAASRANVSAELAEDAYDLADTANQKVDTLREVVSKFHNNIVETASGKVITVSDSAEAPLQGLKVFGKTEQRTTTGKNLLKNLATTQTINGVTFTVNDDRSITVNGTATDIAYFDICTDFDSDALAGCIPSFITSYINGCSIRISNQENRSSLQEFHSDADNEIVANGSGLRIALRVSGGTSVLNKTFYPMIRLASITDPTYEPYTGGAPSPSPDYPQALESVGDGGSVTVTVVGKNLYNGSLLGGYRETIDGGLAGDGNIFRTIDFEILIPGDYTFSFSVDVKIIRYDGSVVDVESRSKTYYLEVGKHYISFRNSSATVWDSNVKIQLEKGSTATEYEPYTATTATVTPVDSSGNSLYLPGIPVTSGGNYTDANGQQWICDEVDFEKGVYVQRVYSADISDVSRIGNPSWGGGNLFECFLNSNALTAKEYAPIMCSHFKGVTRFPNNGEVSVGNDGGSLYFKTASTTDVPTVDEFKAWFTENQVSVIYELATPIETALTAEELAAFATMQSHYPNTTVYNDAGAHMDLKYVVDTKLYVDKKFEELAKILINKL